MTDWVTPKLEALECHESQFETTMHKDVEGDLQAGFRNRELGFMADMAVGTSFTYAESFKHVPDDEL